MGHRIRGAAASIVALSIVACAGEPPELEPSTADATPGESSSNGPDGPDGPDVEESPTPEETEDGGPRLRSASLRDPLRNRSDNFQENDFGGASLEFVDDVYRMISGGGPLLSPAQAPSLADSIETDVEVTITARDGRGLAGVACGIDDRAYLMVAGLFEDGEPYFAIGLLDLSSGDQRPLRDSNLDDTADPRQVVPETGSFTIGATCEPGDGPDDAVLRMRIDGQEVAAVRSDLGAPIGQPGLFVQSQQADPFTVDFNDFEASGRPA